MEIDITRFFKEADAFEYSASRAERGDNAGPETWANAMQEASTAPLLTTEDELQALRDHVEAMGFGEDVQSYDADQCNAPMIQLVSGDMREGGLDNDPDDAAWAEYEENAEAGRCSSAIFRSGVEVYYCLDS